MKMTLHHVLSILSVSFLLLSVYINCIAVASANSKPNGLSMELVHIFSPASPLYPGNISYEEEIGRLWGHSNARAQQIHATLSSLNTNNMSQALDDLIRPRLEFYPISSYLVQVGLGTFDATFPAGPFKTYYLYTDTGSALIWTLCEDCLKPPHQCFQSKEPPFPNSQSKTYKPLPCNRHPLCTPNVCVGDFCSQHQKYVGGQSVDSILAGETFNFLSTSGRSQPLNNVVFGCAYDAKKMTFGKQEDFKVSGILGLGYSPNSFPVQIQQLTGGAFSFCLVRDRQVQTYLRFGADIPQPPGLRVTPLVLFQGVPYYYVNLQGISVHGHKLLINPQVFAIGVGGTTGGCVLDNGSSYTSLIKPAYYAIIQYLEYYFLKFPKLVREKTPSRFELCYQFPEHDIPLPTLTFHFENADLEVKPEDSWLVFTEGKKLCFAILPNDGRTVFGSMQQTNYRFIYDLNVRQLKFIPEDCAKNS